MSKKVYTEKDIYEGMVLECVENNTSFWTVGKQYVVDKDLCVYDNDGDCHADSDIVAYLKCNNMLCNLKFKVVESEEKQELLQLFNYHFGLKTGDVETKKHITIPAYNTQQAIEYLTNELEYDINDIVSLEVK